MNPRTLFRILPALLAFSAPLHAAPVALDHPVFRLTVDSADAVATFRIEYHGANAATISGTLSPGTAAAGAPTKQVILDDTFGKGERATLPLENGSVAVDVHPSLPFALVRTVLRNTSDKEIDIPTKVVATYSYQPDVPASQLRALGTGGLRALAPNEYGSYLFLACAEPASRAGLVSGWASQLRGSGTVFAALDGNRVSHKAQLEHGHLLLPPGMSTTLDTFAIGHFADARLGLEEFASTVARVHQIQLKPKQAVYCSWYAEGPNRGGAGTAATTAELADFIQKNQLKDFGLGVIQIDDKWQDGPRLHGPSTEFSRVNPNGPYPDGITPTAAKVKAAGLDFGLWWLPFGRNHTQPEFADKQDWFVKRADGTPLRQRSFGGTCLDATHPAVREHLKSLAATLRSWKVDYFKMDGLSVGAGVDHVYINDDYKDDKLSTCQPLHNRAHTNIEALRKGLAIIREGAGPEVFFSGCCASQNMRIYAGSIGLVDSMRVGPDFNHDGEGIRSGPLRGSWVYFLNGKVWWNDPDPCKVRASNAKSDADNSATGAVTLEQARLTSSWVALTNQFFLISDWLPDLPPDRIEVLKRTMAGHNGSARPVDCFDNNLPNTWLVHCDKSGTDRHVLGFFNFYPQPNQVTHTFANLGLDTHAVYHAYDYWANTLLPDIKADVTLKAGPNSCAVLALRKAVGHPVLLSTSRHVTQGIIDVSEETWDGKSLAGRSRVIANDPYELRLRVPDAWQAGTATVLGPDQRPLAAETISSPGLLRVKVTPSAAGEIRWSVGFSRTP